MIVGCLHYFNDFAFFFFSILEYLRILPFVNSCVFIQLVYQDSLVYLRRKKKELIKDKSRATSCTGAVIQWDLFRFDRAFIYQS